MTHLLHPACAAWPQMAAGAFAKLVDDIKSNGLLNPVWRLPDGQIIDGKTRLRACEEAGAEPRFQTYEGDDPVGFTISQNERRRHMIPAKLALIGEELAKLKHGTNQYKKKVEVLARTSTSNETAGEIAAQLGISKKLISDARIIKERAEPHIIAAVESGELGIKNAAAYARHTLREQQRKDSINDIKTKGGALRTPNKKPSKVNRNIIDAGLDAPAKAKTGPSVPLALVKQKFSPLFKRVKEQSRRHIGLISTMELSFIASEGERHLREMENDAAQVSRTSLRVVSPSRSTEGNKECPENGTLLSADQKRDFGPDQRTRS
jgi:hypothetical protein